MEQFTEGESTREEIKDKLRQNFDGKIVRKDLTRKSRKEQMFRFMFLSSCWGSIAVQMMKMLLKKAYRM